MTRSAEDEIDDLYEEIKSHTRSCECNDCYAYDGLLRSRRLPQHTEPKGDEPMANTTDLMTRFAKAEADVKRWQARERILRDISTERELQITLGHTPARDIERGGIPHLVEWAKHYADLVILTDKMTSAGREKLPIGFRDDMRPSLIKAASLLIAAVELLDAQETA